jgi:translation elongation factor EF-G
MLTVFIELIVKSRMPQVTGSIISAVRDACRNGLLDWSPRIMLAMYSCDIQASSKSVIEILQALRDANFATSTWLYS